MISRKVQANLDAMLQAPGFAVPRSEDSFFVAAPGFRKKRVMTQGQTTPAGQWMRDQRMLPLGADRIDTTAPLRVPGELGVGDHAKWEACEASRPSGVDEARPAGVPIC